MPIYEYWCPHCRRRVEIIFLRIPETREAACPRCKGRELKRLVSRFSSPKSEEARMAALADPGNLSGLDENDPASMARWVKRMGSEMGEEFGAEEVDRMAEEVASGDLSPQGPGASEPGGAGKAGAGDL